MYAQDSGGFTLAMAACENIADAFGFHQGRLT